MCFDRDSRPPIEPASPAGNGAAGTLRSVDGTSFSVHRADASAPSGAAVIVLPDVRGLHAYYEQLAERFAEAGVDALAIDYFGRTAGTGPRGADFEFMPHVGQARYESLVADVGAAAADLRERCQVRALFTVGFCFGGRLAFLAATRAELRLAGTIGFYGIVAGPGRAGMPAPVELAAQMICPVLGLFGGDDEAIPRDTIEAFDAALAAAGIDHELVTYPGAPHSFFDRKAEQFASESADSWRRVKEFIGRLTPTG
ncbi:MAG TPA: dienelactone hydrolase family protein [Candidatus Limnocylindria bacterium]|nr:dienelactone hydrolase family protein [Candidatus Limnocylindria bacterium]